MSKQELVDKFLKAMDLYDEAGFDDELWALRDEIQVEEGESE